MSYIYKLEDMEEYNYPFERLKHVMGDKNYNKMTGKEKMSEEQKKQDSNFGRSDDKDDEDPQIEEVTDEQAEKIKEEEEARTLVSVWISKGEGRYFPAKMKGRFFSSCRLFEHPKEKKKKKKNFIVFFPPFEPFAPGLPRFLR